MGWTGPSAVAGVARRLSMLRIALAHSHPETLGGGERAVLALADGLSGRHRVRLLVGRFIAERTYPGLARYPATRVGRLQWPWYPVRDDVVVANSFGANLLALRHGRRVAYWAHSTRSLFLQPGATRPDLRLRRATDWLAVRRAGALVANSHFTAGRLRRLYGRGADDVVYPGVDLDSFEPGAARGGYAITVGRLAPEKGLDRLLRFWRALPEVPLLVVGDGPPAAVAALRSLAPTNVTFLGPKLPVEVARLYQEARLAVFTPYAEELGIAALEAMASGVPVVAWRDGGLTETVLDGQTGFLVDDASALQERVRQLARDDRLWRSLAQAARARAETFTWRRTVDQMERVCVRLASQTAGPSGSRRDRAPPA